MKPGPAPRLDLTSLRWSLAVASAGGFRKAADALGVEQSALSRRVRGLEDEIGVSLFHRNPGGATPTFAGVSFIKGVEHALDLLSDTVTEAREAGQGRLGRLKIGLTPSFLSEALFGLLQRFRGAHPHVQIEMVSGEAGDHLSAVADRRLDIAVLPGGMTVTGLDVSELWRETLHVVLPARHPLALEQTIDLQSLNDPLLISEGDLGADVLAQTRLPASVTLKTVRAGLPIVLAQVELGLGLAVITSGALEHAGLPGSLVHRPLHAGEGLSVSFAAAWFHQNDNPALRRFVSSARALR
ncbi:LysR family transcriptional regulator [uncultured Brevundimonas sp.]|uniref:LysR family transcriptional regulator n=1 Tax=Brevundimonas diminuta TaxID=293 RepID=UPI0025DAC00A|nr:LysR family transcriptional regulator [uncultured Brevundimonas sp.]